MKRKRIILAAASVMAAALTLTACGKKQETMVEETAASTEAQIVETETQSETETETETEATTVPVIEERSTVDGKMQSYLTGEWKDEEVVTRRPIAVMIPNNSQAMPQYGNSQASVIYEAPVEGRITRLMAIFEDFDDLDHIGPVRSSRDYFVYTAMGYEAVYCNWGLARPYVEELINRDTVQNISAGVEGIYKPADEAYGRIKRPGYKLEFTGYLFIDGLKDAVERLKYDWEYDDDYVPQFTFVAEDYRAEYKDAEDAVIVRPGGTGANSGGYGAYNPYFEYNEEDQLYYRYQDGKKQIDEMNNEQLAVSNVVFQYCHGEVRDAKDYLAFGVHGEGDAIVFTGGKAIKGTWSRMEGDGVPPKFYDEDGNEIIFNQGKTWICNIWKEFSEFAEYE